MGGRHPDAGQAVSHGPGVSRRKLDVRVSEAAVKLLDERAEAEGIDRSELIRRLLKYALSTMPKGWNK